MKIAEFAAQTRTPDGTRGATRVRREGLVPCVLYGEDTNTHFTLEQIPLKKVIHSPNTFRIKLVVNGKQSMALIKEVQFHPVSDAILHVDFLEMNDNKKTVVELGVQVAGQSPGVRKGGRMVQNFRKLKVRGLPKSLPEHLDVDVSALEIGDEIRVRDLKFPDLKLLDQQDAIVVAVRTARAVVLEAPVEAAEGDEVTEGAEGAEGTEAPAEGGDAKEKDKE